MKKPITTCAACGGKTSRLGHDLKHNEDCLYLEDFRKCTDCGKVTLTIYEADWTDVDETSYITDEMPPTNRNKECE